MIISNEEMEKLIEKYQVYVEKIISHVYYFAEPEVKDELRHVGLIGLWKGISAYYKKNPEVFDHKEFVDTICAYIRYEMADLFQVLKAIRISNNRWRNFIKVKKLIAANPDVTEDQLKCIITEAGLRYDWYLSAKAIMSPISLDMTIIEDSETDIYNFLHYNDNSINCCTEQSYVDYIIDSAMYGIKSKRDKELICTWLNSINSGKDFDFVELGKIYKLSSGMVGIIINRFVDVCRFVRDCEFEFLNNSNGIIYFPEIAEKNKTHDGAKIPGVKWVLRNRKWKVEISVGKNKSVYIGYFETYEDAVKARRDAEIKYRGFSEIEI